MCSGDDAGARPDTRSARRIRRIRRARRRRMLTTLVVAPTIGLAVLVGDGIDLRGDDASAVGAATSADPTTESAAPAVTAAVAPAADNAAGGTAHGAAGRSTFSLVPAAAVTGLTRPGVASTSYTAAVTLTPAVKARLAAEARASRAAARGMDGARPGFARPVDGTRFTSRFGMRWGRLHAGVDFAGPVGLPIRAVSAGTVTVAGPASGYGQLIEVRHDNGEFSRYGHVSAIHVKVGQKIAPGHVIGDLGNEGRSTGPHLHFEIRTPAGDPIDPMPWLKDRRITPFGD